MGFTGHAPFIKSSHVQYNLKTMWDTRFVTIEVEVE